MSPKLKELASKPSSLESLDVEQKNELCQAIEFYIEGHRASNEEMHFFLRRVQEELQ